MKPDELFNIRIGYFSLVLLSHLHPTNTPCPATDTCLTPWWLSLGTSFSRNVVPFFSGCSSKADNISAGSCQNRRASIPVLITLFILAVVLDEIFLIWLNTIRKRKVYMHILFLLDSFIALKVAYEGI